MTTLEIVLSIISVISIGCGIFFSILNASRSKEEADKGDATQMATVIVKLDNISSTVNEIKIDNRESKMDIQDLRERFIKIENKVDNLEDIVYQDLPRVAKGASK